VPYDERAVMPVPRRSAWPWVGVFLSVHGEHEGRSGGGFVPDADVSIRDGCDRDGPMTEVFGRAHVVGRTGAGGSRRRPEPVHDRVGCPQPESAPAARHDNR
jgi:hypothetical protein